MKEILIMRHGKSDWSDETKSDFNRPLNKRGQHDAPLIGKHLKENNLVPEVIFVSPAQRAVETCDLFCQGANYNGEIKQIKELYYNEEAFIKNFILNMDNKYKRVMIIGHNPSFENVVSELSKEVPDDFKMPTSCIAFLQLNSDKWSDSGEGFFELKKEISPKDIT